MHYKHRCGFTLIELLVAISILAIVAVLGWRGLDSIVRSRNALTAELEQTRSLQLTFAQLQSDCTQAISLALYPNLPGGRALWIEPQLLVLMRTVYAEDQAPAVQVVTYRLDNDNLIRSESASTRDLSQLSALVNAARIFSDQQSQIVMQKHISSLNFRGYPEFSVVDGNAAVGTTVVPSANPAAGTSALPAVSSLVSNQSKTTLGLQVTLQLAGHEQSMVKIFILGGA
jgi:general secretion pathway protein J